MKSQFCGIYMITNNIGGKIYVGQSKNIFARWSKHIREAFTEPFDNSILHKAIRKYDISCFQFKILELCSEDELDKKERFYIDLYEATKDNYNILDGGSGASFKGISNHNSKLKDEDVYNIREQYKNLKTWKEVFEQYKNTISQNTFKDVWIGKTWQHIHMDVYDEEIKLKQRNNYDRVQSHKWMQKLSDEDILKIRTFKNEGFKPKYIYDNYYSHINRNTFNDIWYYHTFKHIVVKDKNEVNHQ